MVISDDFNIWVIGVSKCMAHLLVATTSNYKQTIELLLYYVAVGDYLVPSYLIYRSVASTSEPMKYK